MNEKIDFKTYTIPNNIERKKMIEENYLAQIPDIEIVYDDRPNGGKCIYTVEKAWTSLIPEGLTHRCCLPDDMKLCDNFINIVNRIIKAHPHAVICLWPFFFEKDKDMYFKNDSPYFKFNWICGNGNIMPVELIQPCFDWMHATYGDKYYDQIDDIAMSKWIQACNIDCITVVPGIVQHIGDDSILTPELPPRRSSLYLQNVDDYNWEATELNDFYNVRNACRALAARRIAERENKSNGRQVVKI